MHASKGRKYYACTEKRSQKRRQIMVTITRRDLCRLALLSLMVAFDGRSYTDILAQIVTKTLKSSGIALMLPQFSHLTLATLIRIFQDVEIGFSTSTSPHLI